MMANTHAADRAWERYGIELSNKDLAQICRRCLEGEGKTQTLENGCAYHTIIHADRVLWIVFDPAGRGGKGVIRTIMPPRVGMACSKNASRERFRRINGFAKKPRNKGGASAMRGLIGCEASGVVRRAFLERGHDVWSCDLRPAEDGSNRHIRGDVRDLLNDGWDFLFIAHPPCTRLCNSGVRWLSVPPPGRTLDDMQRELREGAALFSDCWNAPIDMIAVENPVMHKHAKALIRNFEPHAQSVQPWQFGDAETKRTCFWLKNLPPLVPSHREKPQNVEARVWRMPPGPDRQLERSRFFPGIATAMAEQWGGHAAAAVGRAA